MHQRSLRLQQRLFLHPFLCQHLPLLVPCFLQCMGKVSLLLSILYPGPLVLRASMSRCLFTVGQPACPIRGCPGPQCIR